MDKFNKFFAVIPSDHSTMSTVNTQSYLVQADLCPSVRRDNLKNISVTILKVGSGPI